MSPRRDLDRLEDMRDAFAQRNVVVHEYHRLDLDSLWDTAKQDLPQLDEQLADIEQAEREAAGSAGGT